MRLLGKKRIFFKQNKGITLIALIITIIVLLILAGVAINTLSGDSGIINRSVNAKKGARDVEIEEKVYLDVSASKINKDSEVDENKLRKWLGKSFGEEGKGFILEGNKIDGWIITIPENESSYFVNAEGEMEKTEYEAPIDNSDSLVLGFVDDLGTRAMIYLYANPDKCTAGETVTITDSQGNTLTNVDDEEQATVKAVAKNGEGKLTITGEDYQDAKKYYIAYPVTKNGTYEFKATKTGANTPTVTTIKVKNIEKFTAIEDIEGINYYNSENKAYNYQGAAVPKGYFVDTKSNVDTGLVITDEIDSNGYSIGNEWVWVPVNSIIGNDEFYDTDLNDTIAGCDEDTKALKYNRYSILYDFKTDAETKVTSKIARIYDKPSTTTGFREIGVLTSTLYGEKANLSSNPIYSRATAKNSSPTSLASEKAVAEQYIKDYYSMTTSVDTYHGFYIGRYEMTANGEKPGTSLTNSNWFSLYNKCMTLNKDYTETSMMYGTLWDATMQWLAKKRLYCWTREYNKWKRKLLCRRSYYF